MTKFYQPLMCLVLFAFLAPINDVQAQVPGAEIGTYDTYHLIPPLYAKDGINSTGNIQHHYLYLSTAEVTPFNVTIQNAAFVEGGAGATGAINQTVSVSKASPTLVTLSAGPYGGIGAAALGILEDADLNSVNTTDGLILTGPQRFYANLRHSSGSQGTSLTSKGQTAFGQRFRSGHLHTNDSEAAQKSHFISVMALEDTTTVNFSDISPGITFVDGAGGTTTPGPAVLDQYESYVIGVRLDQHSNTAGTVENDLNGTLVTSDKPIVMNSGSYLAGAEGSGRDIGTDQVLPTGYLGTKFILVEGGGGAAADVLETPIIVADTDNTEIFLKGSATPYAEIDAGEYEIIPGTEYPVEGVMFIRTSEPAYVYQSTSSNSSNGNGLNFVAAIQDNLEVQDVLIPDAAQLGTPTISVVAPVTASITLDGVLMAGATAVPGISEFVLYQDFDETGDVEITGTEPFLVTFTSVAGARGAAGYFVGFPNSYAVKDKPTTPPETAVNIDVQANDVVGTFTFTVTAITQPTNGLAVLNGDGTITYTPDNGFVGVDTFTYTIDNGGGLTDVGAVEVAIDSDGDGVGNIDDLDDDNDGIPDSVEGTGDTDGDGTTDELDLDSDNDGIFDLHEAVHSGVDANNDGRIDSFAGDNGLADIVETVAESDTLNYTVGNQDGDTLDNYKDLDSDNDGIPDNIEAHDPTGTYTAPGLSYNGDGVDTVYPNGIVPYNTTGTGNPDYINTDSDGVGASDTIEAGLTLAGTTGANGLDSNYETIDDYSDPNGTFPLVFPDGDNDGIPDHQDNNVPSTDLAIDGGNTDTVDENVALGTTIGTFTTTDADVGDTFTYSLTCSVAGADDGLFQIDGADLETNSALDFEVPTDNNADGTYEVCVVSNDGHHDYEETITISVNDLDEIPPNAPVVNQYREGDGPISGTAEVGATLTFTTDNAGGPTLTCSNAPVIADGGGNWTCLNPSPTPAEGDMLTAIATDAALNPSIATNFTILPTDGTPPTPPIIDPFTVGDAAIAGVAEPGTTVTLTGITCAVNPITVSASGVWTCTTPVPAPTDGQIITATATDVATNTSATTTMTVIDTGEVEPPLVNAIVSGTTTLTGTAEPGATINLTTSAVGGPGISCSNSPIVADFQGNWSCDTPSPVMTSGDTISVTQTTGSGTSDPTSTTVVDSTTVAPPAPTVGSTDGDPVTGTTIPNGTVNVIDKVTGTVLCTTTANGTGDYTCTPLVPATTDGQEISVVVTDPATNSQSNPTIVTVDQDPPALPTITSPAADADVNNPTTITGTCETGATVSIANANLVTNPTTTTCAAGSYSVDITWQAGADGNTETIQVTQTDLAGNTSGNADLDLAVDLTPPATPTITSHVDNDADNNPTRLEGACETDATISISNVNLATNPTTVTCTAGTYQVDLTWLPAADGNTETLTVTQTDPAGNVAVVNAAVDIAVDLTTPSLSGTIGETIGDDSATITWTTDEPASSEIAYGLATVTNQTTGEQNVSPRVLSHSLNLTGLLSCTTYYYEIISRDAAGNELTDGIHEFSTGGCVGGANVQSRQTSNVVPNVGGGTVQLTTPGVEAVELNVPTGYNATHGVCPAGAFFQTRKLDEPPVVTTLGIPAEASNSIGIYELSAYCDPSTRVTTFDQPVTVTMTYDANEVENYNLSTLQIYRYNTGTARWEPLNNCSIDTANNQVTCETSSFSTFGIFGAYSGGGAGSIKAIIGVCNPEKGRCENRYPAPEFGVETDTAYQNYERCLKSIQKSRQDCAEEWAIEKGLQVCVGNLQCGLSKVVDAFKSAASGSEEPAEAEESLADKYPNETTEALSDQCSMITYKRYPSLRGTGVESYKFSDAKEFHKAYQSLIDLAEQRVVEGDGDTGLARLDSAISRSETVKIFTIAREDSLRLGSCLERSKFPDVVDDQWFHNFVQNMEANNIVHGYSDGYYRPTQTIVKAEIYKIVALSFGYITKDEARAQALVREELWYEPYQRLVESRLNLPADILAAEFDKPMTRGEVFIMLSKALELADR